MEGCHLEPVNTARRAALSPDGRRRRYTRHRFFLGERGRLRTSLR